MPRLIPIGALQELVTEHADCDTGEGLATGCTLLDDLRELLLKYEPDGSHDEPQKCPTRSPCERKVGALMPLLENCVACGLAPISAATNASFCSACWWSLPAPTRAAYANGTASVKRVARMAVERRASVREFGGGKRR